MTNKSRAVGRRSSESDSLKSSSPISLKRSVSSPVSLELIDNITAVGRRLIILSNLLDKISDKESITVNEEQIFGKIKIYQTTHNERERCLKVTLKNIKLGAEFGLTNLCSQQGNISLTTMIEMIQEQKWSSKILSKSDACRGDLLQTIETIKKSELFVQNLKHTKEIKEANFTIEFLELLFPGKMECDKKVYSNNLTLPDLSLIFTKLMSFENLLKKVLQILGNENLALSKYECKKIGQFCLKCIENEIALNSYSNLEIENLIQHIAKYLSLIQQDDLIKAYHSKISKIKTEHIELKIAPLNPNEIEQVNLWRDSIRYPQLQDNIAKPSAKCLNEIVCRKLSQIPLDELLSAKLEDRNRCPKFNECVDAINFITNLVVQDILIALNDPSGKEMSISYGQEVYIFYAKLVQESLNRGDFASAYALYMGLSRHPVSRLENIWNGTPSKKGMPINKGLPSKIKDLMQGFVRLFDPDKNFKVIKDKMEGYYGGSFTVPPFLFSKNITFIEINPSENENGIINPSKFQLLAKEVILPFQKMKSSFNSFDEQSSIFYRRLETMDTLNEDDLYKLSYKIEPLK